MMKYFTKTLVCMGLLCAALTYIQAQNIPMPRASQQASVTQRVGITDISIVYHSPAVKDRKIWGALVPFGQVWRAGANENTIISFTHPVKVEGAELAAGKYGLYMIPSENSVEILFSSAIQNWGTVAPTEDEIVAKVSVTPISGPPQEWLSFDFIERGGNEVTAALKWEEWIIPFKIGVDVPKIVLDNARAELKGVSGFGYLGKEQVARYCLFNDVGLDEALTWIDQSINAEKRFSNLTIKSGLLKKKGDIAGSEAVMQEALTYASPVQMNIYGYQLLNSGDTDGAVKVFLKNIADTPKTHPFYWGFVDSVGEAYLNKKDKANALKYYKMAKEYAPEGNQSYLDGVISGIMEK